MTTIHAYTNDQQILDLPHSDLRRARAAAINLIPTSTGAATRDRRSCCRSSKGKVDGISVRAPVPTGSVTDLVVHARARRRRAEEINAAFEAAASDGPLAPYLELLDRAARLDRHRPVAVLVHLRQRADDGERQLREGLRLVRQRVGLLVPARRSRARSSLDEAAALGRRRGRRRQGRPRPVGSERAARGRPGRRRHAHPRVAADAAAAARARRGRGARLLAPRPAEEARTSEYAIAPGARARSRELARRRPRARAREHALRPARDGERRGVRARARRRLRPLRQRRVRLGAPRARVDRGRGAPAARLRAGCCCSTSSSTSGSCSATSSGRS